MVFPNREEAAELLVEPLKKLEFKRPLVLAIPRGAIPLGRVLAERLGADLDVILVHKFCPYWQPELAIGAVTEDGEILVGEVAASLGMSDEEIETSARKQIKKLEARRAYYTPFRKAIDPAGREVIIVDDGIATGATVRAAVALLRKKNPARIVVAAPVSSQEAAAALKRDGVETCFLATPASFYAVGQFYEDFSTVEDDEVARILTEFSAERKTQRAKEIHPHI